MNKLLTIVMEYWSKLQRILLQIPIIGWIVDLLTLCLSSFILRFASGHWVASNLDECERPVKTLKLYEFEFCPFCRRVRETLNVLDLDCIIYPCPRETLTQYGVATKESRYRLEAKKIGGKAQFPLLIDENVSSNDNKDNNDNDDNNDDDDNEKPLIMYESGDIIKYLWKKYGSNAKAPLSYTVAQKSGFITLALSNLVRSLPEYGLIRIPSKKPEKMLELWEFESSPYCKRVREILSCLELPYLKKSAARGSQHRREFRQRFSHLLSAGRKKIGLIQVPLLVDPNYDDRIILESSVIVKYLLDTYKIGEMKQTRWDEYSTKKAQ